MKKIVELNDLIGKHKLSGVDIGTIKNKREYRDYDDCEFIKFCLDGITYMAIEDPNDGYRSCMDEILICDEECINKFSDQEVMGRMKEGDNETLELLNVNTGNLVLEVGTDYVSDYYPVFRCDFDPKELDINKNKK